MQERESEAEFPVSLNVDMGFTMMYDSYYEEQVAQFERQWGSLEELSTYVRALYEGTPEHRLLALCVLGYLDALQTHSILLHYLHSPSLAERCASAIGLARQGDAIALPVLLSLLTHYTPSEREQYTAHDERHWVFRWRYLVIEVIRQWNEPSIVIALRTALREYLRLEHVHNRSFFVMDEQLLCYELGRRGAFGALTGLTSTASRLRLAMIEVAVGASGLNDHSDVLLLPQQVKQNNELKHSLCTALAHAFGLSTDEQEQYVASYGDDWMTRMQGEGWKERILAYAKLFNNSGTEEK